MFAYEIGRGKRTPTHLQAAASEQSGNTSIFERRGEGVVTHALRFTGATAELDGVRESPLSPR